MHIIEIHIHITIIIHTFIIIVIYILLKDVSIICNCYNAQLCSSPGDTMSACQLSLDDEVTSYQMQAVIITLYQMLSYLPSYYVYKCINLKHS